jgi:hypothetical protein
MRAGESHRLLLERLAQDLPRSLAEELRALCEREVAGLPNDFSEFYTQQQPTPLKAASAAPKLRKQGADASVHKQTEAQDISSGSTFKRVQHSQTAAGGGVKADEPQADCIVM